LPWLAVGAAWIFFWFVRKGIISSYLTWPMAAPMRRDGRGPPHWRDRSRADDLATIVGYAVTNSTFPRTIPLQAGLQKPLTPITTEAPSRRQEQVTADLQGGVYKVPGREMSLSVKVKNALPSLCVLANTPRRVCAS